MKKKSIPLYTKILIGIAIGLIIGMLAVNLDGDRFVFNWIKPFGEIFIRLLKLIAIPLVLISLIKGIGGMKDISKLATMGMKTLLIYIGTTVVAIIVGIGLVTAIRPGAVVSSEVSSSISQSYSSSISSKIEKVGELEQLSPIQPLVDIFPSNIIEAMSNNSAMLQIIFIAIIIGIAAAMIGEKKSQAFIDFVSSLDSIILKIIDIVMKYAPIGVMALMAGLVVDSAGDLSLLGALGMYTLTVILGLFLLMYAFYPLLIHLFTKIKVPVFIRSMLPVQLLAFSTSSSAATLPSTMKVCEEELKSLLIWMAQVAIRQLGLFSLLR